MSERRSVSFVASGGLRLVGDGHGDPTAPPVVLLHGGGQTRHAWGGTAAALARRGLVRASRSTSAATATASGRPTATTRLDALRRRPARRRRAQLAAPPAIVGASLGGLAALLAEGEAPARARRGDRAGRHRAAHRSRRASAASSRFMNAQSGRLRDARRGRRDAVAAYLPHRPRPKDSEGPREEPAPRRRRPLALALGPAVHERRPARDGRDPRAARPPRARARACRRSSSAAA